MVASAVQSITQNGGFNIELILVNDGSVKNVTDDGLAFLEKAIPNLQVIRYAKNRGKGYALRQGVAKATAELMIYTDIDFPYTEKSFMEIYTKLLDGNDVVCGHRGEAYYQNTPYLRKLISKFLRWTLKTFLRLPTDDSQCGIKGFNAKGAKIFLSTQIDRFLFDLEFIKLASKRSVKFQKAAVTLKPDVVFSKVNLKILLREAVNFFKVLRRS